MCFCLSNLIDTIAGRIGASGLLLAVAGAPADHPFSSKNVLNLGFISSPELMASLYRNAQCTLILSKVESFSMPTAESLCCGTPVVGFKAGGPESFANPAFSSFVEQNDLEGLALQILRFSSSKSTKQSASDFEPNLIASEYLKVYR
jgi:putative colanic acid biosynthesis glycosyltransferase